MRLFEDNSEEVTEFSIGLTPKAIDYCLLNITGI